MQQRDRHRKVRAAGGREDFPGHVPPRQTPGSVSHTLNRGSPRPLGFGQIQIPSPRPDPKQVPDKSLFELNKAGGRAALLRPQGMGVQEGRAPPARWEQHGGRTVCASGAIRSFHQHELT